MSIDSYTTANNSQLLYDEGIQFFHKGELKDALKNFNKIIDQHDFLFDGNQSTEGTKSNNKNNSIVEGDYDGDGDDESENKDTDDTDIDSILFCARTLNNRGVIYRRMEKFHEAYNSYNLSLQLKQRVFGENSIELVPTLSNIGNTFTSSAEAIIHDVNMKRKRLKEENEEEERDEVMIIIAKAEKKLKQNFEQAMKYFKQAKQIVMLNFTNKEDEEKKDATEEIQSIDNKTKIAIANIDNSIGYLYTIMASRATSTYNSTDNNGMLLQQQKQTNVIINDAIDNAIEMFKHALRNYLEAGLDEDNHAVQGTINNISFALTLKK